MEVGRRADEIIKKENFPFCVLWVFFLPSVSVLVHFGIVGSGTSGGLRG